MMAAAATMFAACTEADFVNEVSSVPQAIEFESYANGATRNTENSTAGYDGDLSAHHTTFTVWGYKLAGSTAHKVFTNIPVTHSGTWGYTKEVYWDKAASKYNFYAAAPTKADFWTLNEKNADIADDYFTTAEYTVTTHNAATYQVATSPTTSFKEVDDAEDLMIAEDAPVTPAYASPVQLKFIHILSRLNVTVATSLENVTVTEITVGNINNKGSFDESKSMNPTTGSYARWALNETEPVSVISYTNGTDKALVKDAAAVLAIEALVMPQLAGTEVVALDATTFAGKVEPYLYVEYTVNSEVYKRAYNLADALNGAGTNAVPFNEGWQNTLNLTIGAEAITFSTTVAQWADNTGDQSVQ